MPSVYGGRQGEYAVVVHGFEPIQRALQRIDGEERSNYGLAYELRYRFAKIGETVKAKAEEYAPERTGELRKSIAVSITQRSASVYSKTIYGGVQNEGGQVGREHRTLLRRDQVSRFMDRAVDSTREFVETEMNAVVDWLIAEFEATR